MLSRPFAYKAIALLLSYSGKAGGGKMILNHPPHIFLSNLTVLDMTSQPPEPLVSLTKRSAAKNLNKTSPVGCIPSKYLGFLWLENTNTHPVL